MQYRRIAHFIVFERFAKMQTIFRKTNIIVFDNHSLWPINASMRVRTMKIYCIQNKEGNNPWLDSEGGKGSRPPSYLLESHQEFNVGLITHCGTSLSIALS